MIRNQEGQGVVEYILMLSIVVWMFTFIMKQMGDINLMGRLMAPLSKSFAATYRYGHPKAKVEEDGTAVHHPKKDGEESGKLFINPEGED